MENKNIVILGGLGLLALVLIAGRKKTEGYTISPLPTKPLGDRVVFSVPEAKQPSNPTSGTNTGGNSGTKPKPSQGASGFNATEEVKKLIAWLTPVVNVSANNDSAAFLRILNYSDSQLKAVSSTWVEYLKASPYLKMSTSPTLRKQVESEFVAYYRTETVNNKKKIIDRLTKLGL